MQWGFNMENIEANEYEIICEIDLWLLKRPQMDIHEIMQITVGDNGLAWISIDSYVEPDKYYTLEDPSRGEENAKAAFTDLVKQAIARSESIKRYVDEGKTVELLRLQDESIKQGILLY